MVNPERANPELLPLSLLNDFLYCPRRAALKTVEGWRSANQHTARGDIVHEHADLPGYEVAMKGSNRTYISIRAQFWLAARAFWTWADLPDPLA